MAAFTLLLSHRYIAFLQHSVLVPRVDLGRFLDLRGHGSRLLRSVALVALALRTLHHLCLLYTATYLVRLGWLRIFIHLELFTHLLFDFINGRKV